MENTETAMAWLSQEDLDSARARLPILYVHAIPVRVDDRGDVTQIGLLLRARDGRIDREFVGGRVKFHERIRDALVRHIATDLGATSWPRIPVSPIPMTVVEAFPTPGITPFHDPRQHLVSLVFIVPVLGECAPQQDSLDLSWLTPDEAAHPAILDEMDHGHGVLMRQALAHIGHEI